MPHNQDIRLSEIVIGSILYQEALEIRYQLFFQQLNLPRTVMIDPYEKSSQHFIISQKNKLSAYGRLTHLDKSIFQISQMVVIPQYQSQGLGTKMLKSLVSVAIKKNANLIKLNARLTATSLYEKQGFKKNGAVFLSKKTAIEHIEMILKP